LTERQISALQQLLESWGLLYRGAVRARRAV
jgi:hypothetical protein